MIAYRDYGFSLILTRNPTLDGTERNPTSGAIAAMAILEGFGRRLSTAQAAALETAVVRSTEDGGSEQGKSLAARAAAWRALVCQRFR